MTAVEPLERRDRAFVAIGLGAAAALAWAWLVAASLDMYGDMDGPSAWMMQAHWDLRYGALILLMWVVMMVGMMLPSALPTIVRLAKAGESGPRTGTPVVRPRVVRPRVVRPRVVRPRVVRAYAFGGGYLLVWTTFSVVATLLQWGLAELRLLSPMMEVASPRLAAWILIAAGIYQWTPLKGACLAHCRAPCEASPRDWHLGAVTGALRMGLVHGAACVGCCWALMLLLFAGGVMSLAVMGAIALLLMLEKLTPLGLAVGRLAGVALVATGAWLLLS